MSIQHFSFSTTEIDTINKTYRKARKVATALALNGEDIAFDVAQEASEVWLERMNAVDAVSKMIDKTKYRLCPSLYR